MLAGTVATVDVQFTPPLAAIHGRRQRVRAVALDETPRGVAKMRTGADAPPISHVVNEFEGCCVVGYAQCQTAIGTCYRLERLCLTHAHPRKHRAKTAGEGRK
jgi:hypothetical protein